MTWFEAENYCRSEGGKLVEVNSEEENRVIDEKIMTGGYQSRNMWFWIGLTDKSEERTWRYASDGEIASFFNWDTHYPNNPEPNNANNNEDCALIRSGGCRNWDHNGWADFDCEEKKVRVSTCYPEKHYTVNALCEFEMGVGNENGRELKFVI